MIRHTLVGCVALLALAVGVSGHPRGSGPDLAELNDYLAGLHWLADRDPEARELFEQWQALREESWTIRALTDEGDLEIGHPIVAEQIETVRALRRQLLDECRRFFSSRHDRMPTAVVRWSGSVAVEWDDPLIHTTVGERRLVLVELRNDSEEAAFVQLESGPGRQVFAWKQSISLAPGAARHTFVHVLPVREGDLSPTVRLRWSPDPAPGRTPPRRRARRPGTALQGGVGRRGTWARG